VHHTVTPIVIQTLSESIHVAITLVHRMRCRVAKLTPLCTAFIHCIDKMLSW